MIELRQIFLLRHAKSSWAYPGLEDFDRPLNERGVKTAAAMGHYMSRQGLVPDMILCSPSARTLATLDGLKGGLGHALQSVAVDVNADIYEASYMDLLALLRGVDPERKRVLMIGHCPGIAHLAIRLTNGHGDAAALDKLAEKFPTCSLAVLNTSVTAWSDLDQGECRLSAFVRPSDFWD